MPSDFYLSDPDFSKIGLIKSNDSGQILIFFHSVRRSASPNNSYSGCRPGCVSPSSEDLPHAYSPRSQEHLPGALAPSSRRAAYQKLIAGESALSGEACALWGFRAGDGCHRGAPGALETVRRGETDPETGRKTPHHAFVQGQNAPVRATRTSWPPRFRGGRLWPARPDRVRGLGGRCRSAGGGPESAPGESGGSRAVQRAHPLNRPGNPGE